MSEYPGIGRQKSPQFDDLDHTGTLFDPANTEPDIDKSGDAQDRLNDQGFSYAEARDLLGQPQSSEPITDKEQYPYWTPKEYYERRLGMLAVIGDITKLESFGMASQYKQSIEHAYSTRELTHLQKNSQSKVDRKIYEFRSLYGESELKRTGNFDEQDIRDDSNMMLQQMRQAYSGPENKSRREKERRRLLKQLNEINRAAA